MTRPLPSEDEIRASFKRHRSSAGVEYLGCLIVLVCTALGIAAGILVIQSLGGVNQLNEKHAEPQIIVLLLGGGGAAGFVAGVLITQLIRLIGRAGR